MNKTKFSVDRGTNRPPGAMDKKRLIVRLKPFFALFMVLSLLFVTGGVAVISAGNALMSERKALSPRQPDSLPGKGPLLTTEDEEYVAVRDMPDYVRQAFIAIEDHRFSSHFGIDPLSLVRALLVDLRAGKMVQGGSTITMQLARNGFLTHEKTMNRKLKEMIIAINLERRYSKAEILGIYLNNIYFGHGEYGIEKAAHLYFGKTIRAHHGRQKTISLSEAAMLAALPKSPELYSPIKNPEKALQRRNLVLKRMAELRMITHEEMETAMEKDLSVVSDGFSDPEAEPKAG
ncbi:transglycosylase domain-containing protein [Paludifilum halophilum]|uniref:Glycosyl transferase family 51 domain-containing protein n=1 Tax=Paludifilum halophilum TaxID=1642702 RepID=A0A235B987_9BACL|nr:transglycosylase domain-containing protein [Paludifilum halophilum]OYD08854.1 hypothetical protein CHM34_03440 [Paludifilum halophilum]